jgi:hypothetical protein
LHLDISSISRTFSEHGKGCVSIPFVLFLLLLIHLFQHYLVRILLSALNCVCSFTEDYFILVKLFCYLKVFLCFWQAHEAIMSSYFNQNQIWFAAGLLTIYNLTLHLLGSLSGMHSRQILDITMLFFLRDFYLKDLLNTNFCDRSWLIGGRWQRVSESDKGDWSDYSPIYAWLKYHGETSLNNEYMFKVKDRNVKHVLLETQVLVRRGGQWRGRKRVYLVNVLYVHVWK